MNRSLLLLFATTVFLPGTARAWDAEFNINSDNPTLRAASVSFPAGNPYTDILERSVARFDNNPSDFWYSLSLNDGSVWHGNLQHEIWFEDMGSDGPPATIYYATFCGPVIEFDIIFNSAFGWTSSDSRHSIVAYGGSHWSFWAEMMHMLCHGSGLQHESGTYNALGDGQRHLYLNGDAIRTGPGEDVAVGLVSLYGSWNGAGQDLAVTHWKRTGSDSRWDDPAWDLYDQMSWNTGDDELPAEHGQTIITNRSGQELSYVEESGGMRRYLVPRRRRGPIGVQFTYENNGRSSQTVTASFRLSVNNTITNTDHLLRTETYSMGRNTVWTNTQDVEIPPWIAAGDYHLGVIIDGDDSVSEVSESNNAAYLAIRLM